MDRRTFVKVMAAAPAILSTLSAAQAAQAVVVVDETGKLGVRTLQEGIDLLPEEGGTLKVHLGLYAIPNCEEWLLIGRNDPPFNIPIMRKGYTWCGTCWKEHRKDFTNCRYSWDHA